jgi:hypothetical protein
VHLCYLMNTAVQPLPLVRPPEASRAGGGGGSPERLSIYSVLSMCGRCPRREQSAHVGASPPLSRSLGCGGGGAPPKGLCPPAEPPTPCVPRVCDCAVFFSALHLAIRLNSTVVLCNIEARQSLGVIYSRERRSVRSPDQSEASEAIYWKVRLNN